MSETKVVTVNRQPWGQLAILALVGIFNPLAIGYLGQRSSTEQTKLNHQFWYDQQAYQQDQKLYDLKYDLMLSFEEQSIRVRNQTDRFLRSGFRYFSVTQLSAKYPSVASSQSEEFGKSLRDDKQALEESLMALTATLNKAKHYFQFDSQLSSRLPPPFQISPKTYYTAEVSEAVDDLGKRLSAKRPTPAREIVLMQDFSTIEDRFLKLASPDTRPLYESFDAATDAIYAFFDNYYVNIPSNQPAQKPSK